MPSPKHFISEFRLTKMLKTNKWSQTNKTNQFEIFPRVTQLIQISSI